MNLKRLYVLGSQITTYQNLGGKMRTIVFRIKIFGQDFEQQNPTHVQFCFWGTTFVGVAWPDGKGFAASERDSVGVNQVNKALEPEKLATLWGV